MIKNYKELCQLLDVPVKSGKSKMYQLVDFSRFFKSDKDGNKFIITEILDTPENKKGRGGNNLLPFIDEMELLIINMLLKHDKQMTISNSKLLLELCMVNPNYYEFFNNKEDLAEILKMDIAYIIDYYDSTNTTFKSAINTVMKRLENKKMIIHEKVMMVLFVDTDIHTTPTGYSKASDIFYYDSESNKYIHRNVTPKEVYRTATAQEKEYILQIEQEILNNKYNTNNIQTLFHDGRINDYYIDVSKELYKSLNIKKAYMANQITIHNEALKNEQIKLLNQYELSDTQKEINYKVKNRIYEGAEKKHNKAVESNKNTDKQLLRRNEQYIHNNDILINNLIDKDKKQLEKSKDSNEDYIDQYILDSLPDDF